MFRSISSREPLMISSNRVKMKVSALFAITAQAMSVAPADGGSLVKLGCFSMSYLVSIDST